MRAELLLKSYEKCHEEALPKVMTPHTLRHTFCTNLANAGMNPKALQYIMGHSNITMTVNLPYGHTNQSSQYSIKTKTIIAQQLSIFDDLGKFAHKIQQIAYCPLEKTCAVILIIGKPNQTKENHLNGSPLFVFSGKPVFGTIVPRA